jgi:hypothetical protein
VGQPVTTAMVTATTGCDAMLPFTLGFVAGVLVALIIVSLSIRALNDLMDE